MNVGRDMLFPDRPDFKTYMSRIGTMVNDFLDKHLAEDNCLSDKLGEAVRYSALAGGKRIRPALCIMTAEALGVTGEYVLKAGCALELVHTYSLIHDDLPAMDNDDYRRGKLTNHKVYGEATAILAGDALLTEAFKWLSQLNYDDGNPVPSASKLIYTVASLAGINGMIGGQMLDLAGEHKKVSREYLIKMQNAKTGALLTAPMLMGLYLASDDEYGSDHLKDYGKDIGLLFQIVDDILDVEGDASSFGKETGRDAELEKATYPSLMGLDAAKDFAKSIHDEAIKHIEKFESCRRERVDSFCDCSRFYSFTDYLLHRKF